MVFNDIHHDTDIQFLILMHQNIAKRATIFPIRMASSEEMMPF